MKFYCIINIILHHLLWTTLSKRLKNKFYNNFITIIIIIVIISIKGFIYFLCSFNMS